MPRLTPEERHQNDLSAAVNLAQHLVVSRFPQPTDDPRLWEAVRSDSAKMEAIAAILRSHFVAATETESYVQGRSQLRIDQAIFLGLRHQQAEPTPFKTLAELTNTTAFNVQGQYARGRAKLRKQVLNQLTAIVRS